MLVKSCPDTCECECSKFNCRECGIERFPEELGEPCDECGFTVLACAECGETYQKPTGNLTWEHGRWHCDGKGIHAGSGMELRGQDGSWFHVRIESSNHGRNLIAFVNVHGHSFTKLIDTDWDALRWPNGH